MKYVLNVGCATHCSLMRAKRDELRLPAALTLVVVVVASSDLSNRVTCHVILPEQINASVLVHARQ